LLGWYVRFTKLPPESEKRGKKPCATRQVKERTPATLHALSCNEFFRSGHGSCVDPATFEIPLDPLSHRLLGSAALFLFSRQADIPEN
jgi:hypothetical protein